MTVHLSRSVSTVMSRAVEPRTPWDLATLQNWANEEFPEAFNAVTATIDGINFQELEDSSRIQLFNNATVKLPFDTIRHMLVVGEGNSGEFKGKRAIAYVTSEKCAVGYLMSRRVGDYWKLAIESNMHLIDFEEPFSDVGDAFSPATIHKKIRTLVLYFYLAKGLIREIRSFTTFPQEFRWTCLHIANGGKKPEPQIVRKGTSRTQSYIISNRNEAGEEEGPKVSVDVAISNDEQSPCIKRERDYDEPENEVDDPQKRQAAEPTIRNHVQPKPNYSADIDPFFDLQEQMNNRYLEISNKNRVLIKNNQAVMDAYLELNQKCVDLRIQLEQKDQEIRNMRETFQKAVHWKRQAEAGQAAQKELLDFKNEAATAFSKLMGGGSG